MNNKSAYTLFRNLYFGSDEFNGGNLDNVRRCARSHSLLYEGLTLSAYTGLPAHVAYDNGHVAVDVRVC